MAHTLFISDLHLSEGTPATEAALHALLARERDAGALYILGDFFEAWIGDDEDSPLADRIRAALRDFSAAGPALYLMRGNRDFMLGEQFAADTGATLLGDSVVIDIAGRRALIMHGDTLCTDDVAYQQFRALVHDANWQREMLSKSLEERRALAQQLRAMSADAASNKAEDIMDVNADTVVAVMEQAAVDLLIHGHTHRPARHTMSHGRERIVLGDWTTTGWTLRCEGEHAILEQFPIPVTS